MDILEILQIFQIGFYCYLVFVIIRAMSKRIENDVYGQYRRNNE